MNRRDLRACDLCQSPVALNTRDGQRLDFYRVEFEHHLLDMRTIREHAGLALMMGGNEVIADAFASRQQASVATSRRELLICGPCVLERLMPLLAADEAKSGRALPTPEADALVEREW